MHNLSNEKDSIGIPMYHGTSDIFIPSIKEHGLGGKYNHEIFNINILRLLFNKIEENRSHQPDDWVILKVHLEKMTRQEVTSAGFNFQYGNIYISAYEETAKDYSKNRFGSELLTEIYKCFNILKNINEHQALEIIPENHVISKIFKKEPRSAIIKLSIPDVSYIRKETGEPVSDDDISKIKSHINMRRFQPNFRLVKPIHIERLQFIV